MADKDKDHWGFLAEILGTKSTRKRPVEDPVPASDAQEAQDDESTSKDPSVGRVDIEMVAEIPAGAKEISDSQDESSDLELVTAEEETVERPAVAEQEPVLQPVEEESPSGWDVLASQLGLASSTPSTKKPNPVSDWVGESTSDKVAETIDTVRVFGEPEDLPQDNVEAKQKEVLSELFVPMQAPEETTPAGAIDDDLLLDEDTKDTEWLTESLSDDEALVEVERLDGDDERPSRRRRRRRGRGSREDRDKDQQQRPAESEQEVEELDDEVVDESGDVEDKPEPRERESRGRRRRGRRDRRPRTEEPDTPAEELGEDEEQVRPRKSAQGPRDDEKTERRDRGRRRRSRKAEDAVDIDDDDDDDQEKSGKRVVVPTWLDAIDCVIEANIKNHEKNDRRGGGGGGGGGRGRGRGRRN